MSMLRLTGEWRRELMEYCCVHKRKKTKQAYNCAKKKSNILSSSKNTNKRLRVKGLSTFERTSKRPKLTNEHRLNEVTTHEVQPRPILPSSMCLARKVFVRVVLVRQRHGLRLIEI